MCKAEVEPSHAEVEELRAALKRLYHMAPRPWMPIGPKCSYDEWDAAMTEAERLLGYKVKS